MSFPMRPLVALLFSTGLWCTVPAHAADALPAIKTSPGKPAQLKDPEPGREATPGDLQRPRKSAPALPGDPMDRLRDRLTDRLGARVAPDGNADVVKVAASAPDDAASSARRKGGGTSSARRTSTKAPAGGAWSYAGDTGPEHWARLRGDYALCGSGKRQSPIDIRDSIGVSLDPIEFDYKASSFGVMDTGRTVRVNPAPGNFIEIMGRRYQLDRIEFRQPAEERINGRQFDMGAQLIHKDAEGRTAIVAVLLDRGAEQPVIQSIWNNLPLEKGEEVPARSGIDISALLPTDRRYYTYMGSMTTPPCKEGVLWMVMKNPVAISSDQLAIFSRLYRVNARPVQASSGRLIKGWN
jgi:carbonic anhydrase